MNSFLVPVLWLAIWFPDTGQVAPPPAPIVTVYSIPGCNLCTHVKRDTKGDTRDRDWRFVTKLHRNQPKCIRDIAERIEPGNSDPNGYPVIVWKDKAGKQVYATGWTGLARWLRRFQKSMGLPADPSLPEPIPVTPPEPKP